VKRVIPARPTTHSTRTYLAALHACLYFVDCFSTQSPTDDRAVGGDDI